MYRCILCGKDVEIDIINVKRVQCPFCGNRVLEKKRPNIIKRVNAV